MSNDRYWLGDAEYSDRERECERAECDDARANLAAGSRTTGDEAWLIEQRWVVDALKRDKQSGNEVAA